MARCGRVACRHPSCMHLRCPLGRAVKTGSVLKQRRPNALHFAKLQESRNGARRRLLSVSEARREVDAPSQAIAAAMMPTPADLPCAGMHC